MNRLRQFWEMLRASFWFLPTCLVVAAALSGVAIVAVDFRLETDLIDRFPRIFATGVEGAQGMLQSIATSMITVAGVTFSITILILNEASNQYSPRILRNFVRDRSNQFVLGAFLAIFVYCLVVLRAIHDIEGEKFVPPLAVMGGIALALLGIGVLIFFVHHIAYSIQASTILDRAARETLEEIETLYPEHIGAGSDERPEAAETEPNDDRRWHPVQAPRSGYLSLVTADDLLDLAEKHDAVVRLDYKIGDFVVPDTVLFSVCRKDPPTEDEAEEFLETISISPYRTIEQDPSFGIRQLVDIALKALSPSMNDTTTANMALDHLTVILAKLIQRKIASPRRIRNGRLRVIARRPGFAELLNDCLEQIRQNARGNVRVLLQLIHAVRTIVPLTESISRLQALKPQLDLIREAIEASVSSDADKKRMVEACDEALATLRRAIEGIKI